MESSDNSGVSLYELPGKDVYRLAEIAERSGWDEIADDCLEALPDSW